MPRSKKGSMPMLSIRFLEENGDVQFTTLSNMCKDTIFEDIKRAYTKAVGLPSKEIQFRFDGRVIKPLDTPSKLGMEPDDLVEVWRFKKQKDV